MKIKSRTKLQRNVHLPELERLRLEKLVDPDTIELARTYQCSTKPGKRTAEEHRQNCLDGCALQNAVEEYLVLKGYDVQRSGLWSHDLLVDGIKVDVKGRFTKGKLFEQTYAEMKQLLSHPEDVLYLCIECIAGTCIIKGERWAKDLNSTLHPNKGNYVYSDQLIEVL